MACTNLPMKIKMYPIYMKVRQIMVTSEYRPEMIPNMTTKVAFMVAYTDAFESYAVLLICKSTQKLNVSHRTCVMKVPNTSDSLANYW